MPGLLMHADLNLANRRMRTACPVVWEGASEDDSPRPLSRFVQD